jgi:hypothetical protein
VGLGDGGIKAFGMDFFRRTRDFCCGIGMREGGSTSPAPPLQNDRWNMFLPALEKWSLISIKRCMERVGFFLARSRSLLEIKLRPLFVGVLGWVGDQHCVEMSPTCRHRNRSYWSFQFDA